jgi:hypothetical protein
LEILAGDGVTVMATNDDRAVGYGQYDSRIALDLPTTGQYYIRVTEAFRHGGIGQAYTLLLHRDGTAPVVAIRSLAGGSWLHARLQGIRVDASDRQTEVDHINFYAWMPSMGEWQYLASDYTVADGWQYNWNTSNLPLGQGYSIFVYAFDGAGNYSAAEIPGLGLERTPPTVNAATRAVYDNAPFRDFGVTWASGTDTGAGIGSFDIQVRKGLNGAWTNWLMETTLLRARYVGVSGETYFFCARARDKTGNISTFAPGNGDTAFTVQVCPVAKDSYEADDAFSTAKAIRVDGSRYRHNFHGEGNSDWIKFSAAGGAAYVLQTYMVGAHADTVLTLYKGDGSTVLVTNDDAGTASGPSRIVWRAPTTGTYYARVSHADRYGFGCTTTYDVAVTRKVTTVSDVYSDSEHIVDGEIAPSGDLGPINDITLDDVETTTNVEDQVDAWTPRLFLPFAER